MELNVSLKVIQLMFKIKSMNVVYLMKNTTKVYINNCLGNLDKLIIKDKLFCCYFF